MFPFPLFATTWHGLHIETELWYNSYRSTGIYLMLYTRSSLWCSLVNFIERFWVDVFGEYYSPNLCSQYFKKQLTFYRQRLRYGLHEYRGVAAGTSKTVPFDSIYMTSGEWNIERNSLHLARTLRKKASHFDQRLVSEMHQWVKTHAKSLTRQYRRQSFGKGFLLQSHAIRIDSKPIFVSRYDHRNISIILNATCDFQKSQFADGLSCISLQQSHNLSSIMCIFFTSHSIIMQCFQNDFSAK